MLAPSDTSLYCQFEQAEAAFLTSLDDLQSLSSFESSWSELRTDLVNHIDGVDSTTGARAYTTATRIAAVAEALAEIYVKMSDLDLSLESDVGRILHPNTKTLPKQTPLPSRDDSATRPLSNVAGSRAEGGSANSEWFLKNLHYPFPPFSVKKELAKTLNMPVKSLEDWFSNARRKIGWVAFSKRHFKGNRCLTADCTHRILVEGKRDMYGEEVIRELEEVKAQAQRLYGTPAESDASKASCFAEEIEQLEAEMAAIAASKSRKRRFSTCSTASEQTVVASPTSSASPRSSSSRKRAHTSSDDPDPTRSSETKQKSLKPSKRPRSVSSASSRVSEQSSSSTLVSSDTPETVSEVSTPAMSPTHSHMPLEIVDGWIDGLSAASPFPPHDAADKPTVLSHKRPSPDSDSDVDAGTEARTPPSSKRARLDISPSSPATEERNDNNCGTPNPDPERSQSDGDARRALAEGAPAPPSPTSTPTEAFADPLPQTNETATTAASAPLSSQLIEPTGAGAMEGADVDIEAILSQLDYSIPPPPTFWDDEFLGKTLEVTLASLDSFAAGDTGLLSSSGLPDDIDALLAKALVPDSEVSVTKDGLAEAIARQEWSDALVGIPEPSYVDGFLGCSDSTPFSLSAMDFDFLEGLGNPTTDPLVAPSHVDKTSEPLIDIAPISEAPVVDSERAKKLERIDQLLAEAQRLQQEVFG